MRNVAMAAGALLLLGAAHCGNSNTLASQPEIAVSVGEEDLEIADGEASVTFSAAQQLQSREEVQITNPGSAPLTIETIEWFDPDDGDVRVNEHVSIDWSGLGGPDAFPIEVGVEETIRFDVVFDAPSDGTIEDFSDSELVLRSDARSSQGVPIDDLRLVFALPGNQPEPKVEPPNFTFHGASRTNPQSQTFEVGNDGQAPFQVMSVTLQSASDAFEVTNRPNQGHEVLAKDDPGYDNSVATFDVTYHPQEQGEDENTVLVETDALDEAIRVGVSGKPESGNYTVSFSAPEHRFDFTTGPEGTRTMVFRSEGPGAITIIPPGPNVMPESAAEVFDVKVFEPATSPDEEPEELGDDAWPRALSEGKTLEFDVTYNPPGDGSDPAQGKLVVPMRDQPDLELDLFGGEPTPRLELAPSAGSAIVNGSVADGATGTARVVLYNTGNGDLQVTDMAIEAGGRGASQEVFAFADAAPMPPVTVPAHGLRVVPLDWDLSSMEVGSSLSASLSVTYDDPVGGGETGKSTETLGLIAEDSAGKELPTAEPKLAGEGPATVGESVALTGLDSTPGAYEFSGEAYIWYLVDRPESSRAVLNRMTEGTTQLIPDAAGEYVIELVVFTSKSGGGDGPEFLYSRPKQLTITAESGSDGS